MMFNPLNIRLYFNLSLLYVWSFLWVGVYLDKFVLKMYLTVPNLRENAWHLARFILMSLFFKFNASLQSWEAKRSKRKFSSQEKLGLGLAKI